jgi:hypothetical protein
MEKLTVKRYVDRLQSRGQYTFLKKEVQKNIDSSNSAITLALNRLSQKNRIVMIRQGFYIIIPLEYAQAGILPPEWFIQPLMEYAGQPRKMCTVQDFVTLCDLNVGWCRAKEKRINDLGHHIVNLCRMI